MRLAEAFEHQATSCEKLGSPFMARLMGMLACDWPRGTKLDRFFEGVDGDSGPAGASLPLRVAGGLHALVLSGRSEALAAVYPPQDASDAKLRDTVLAVLEQEDDFLTRWCAGAPQTNEVRRSAALIAGAAVVAAHFDRPLHLSELGASGGLNLWWDRYALDLREMRIGPADAALKLAPEWRGPMPPAALPRIAARAGVDLNPLDPARPADMLRLMAFLWPDQPDRLALTRAAAAVSEPGTVTRGDAIDWLAGRLGTAPRGHTHLVQHTVAWQYFPQDAQARGRALIEAAGARATQDTPLAWLAMESDGDTRGTRGALLTLRLWPGDVTLTLGRADFHGRWIEWEGAP